MTSPATHQTIVRRILALLLMATLIAPSIVLGSPRVQPFKTVQQSGFFASIIAFASGLLSAVGPKSVEEHHEWIDLARIRVNIVDLQAFVTGLLPTLKFIRISYKRESVGVLSGQHLTG